MSSRIQRFLKLYFPLFYSKFEIYTNKITDTLYRWRDNADRRRDNFYVHYDNFLSSTEDFFRYTLGPKLLNFFWYFNILERIFDVIEHTCYHLIKLPYERFILHMDTVVLPPIREKYKKWRFKKSISYRFSKKKTKILIYRYIETNFFVLFKFLVACKKYYEFILLSLIKIIFGNTSVTYNKLVLKFIAFCSKKIYESMEDEVQEILSDPDVDAGIKEILFFYGWAWYPTAFTFYQLAFLIYVVWLRYQFFYDTAFANVEFYHQRMEYVIQSRRALFENNEMWGTSYSTASISSDSYYNAYYDKENKFRATHLFYDRFILGAVQSYKVNNWYTQGSSVLHWGSILHWQRQASLKTFNFVSSFVERCLPDYYSKILKNMYAYKSVQPFYYNQRKVYKWSKNFLMQIDPEIKQDWAPKKYNEFSVRPYTDDDLVNVFSSLSHYSWYHWWPYNTQRYYKHKWPVKIQEIPIWDLVRSWWSPGNLRYRVFKLTHFDNNDTYGGVLAKTRSLYWFLCLNKDISSLVYHRNDFYHLFFNAYMACALKNFFVFEQIFSYILNGLNEMTLNESVSRRYHSQAVIQDSFIFSWKNTGFDGTKRFSIFKTCFWENYAYFNDPFRWRATSVYRSRFWDLRAHIGTFLWPVYNGETDTSYWGIRNYFYSFAYHYRPYYYYFNLIHFFYREIFGHMWILFTLMYFGFINAAVQYITEYRKDRYYELYKPTEIKELDYLIVGQIWIKSYKTVYFFLLSGLTLYFVLDYYMCHYTFISVYYSLLEIIKEFQNLNDLYCEFSDYSYGEDFLLLAMSPEFSNYADVSKRFFKDPYLVEELDLYENSFRRRDISSEYEYFMSDNYFYLRLYTSNDYSDNIFYKKWWAKSFYQGDYDLLAIAKDQNWPFIFAPHYYDYKSKIFKNLKEAIKTIRKSPYLNFATAHFKDTRDEQKLKKFYTSVFFKFFFNVTEIPQQEEGNTTENYFYELEKNFYDYCLNHKPYYIIRYKNFPDKFIKFYKNPEFLLQNKYFDEVENSLNQFILSKKKIVKSINSFVSNIFFYKSGPSEFISGICSYLANSLNDELLELEKFKFKQTVVNHFIFKHSPSEKSYYNHYLNHRWLNMRKSNWPFYKNGDDDFTKSMKWCNIINPFSSTSPSFFPHLYFEEEWYQNLLTKTLKKKYRHVMQTYFYFEDRYHRMSHMVKKIIKFQSFLNFPYVMAQRISKSLLYLEVASQLDRMDVENLQNFRLNHEASRTTFSKRFFSTLNKHFQVYFEAKWVYGPWDKRALKLDNSISNFCHYYVRAGRYHNLNRMCSYILGIKKFREEQWENREIPAPPNHMLEEALWYRFVPAFYKKGLGRQRVNPEWFIYSGLGNMWLENRGQEEPQILGYVPFLFFLKHTKDFLFYTFNPQKDIVDCNADFNLDKVPNLQPFFNLDEYHTVFADYEKDTDISDGFLYERDIDSFPDDTPEDKLSFAPEREWEYLSVDDRPFNYFKNNALLNYNPRKASDFNLFQFVFCCYFGQFVENLLTDYYENKNESLEIFEAYTVIPNEITCNIENRLNFYHSSDHLGYNSFYPVQYFGFFSFDPWVKDFPEYAISTAERRGYQIFQSTLTNKFFQIEEISPSWSKIILTIDDIKIFHENYQKLSWLSLLKVVETNNGYWFYILYKSTIIIYSFANILFYSNKLILRSILSFKFGRTHKIYYKIGEFLNKQGILDAISNNIYVYWCYWFVFFIIYQLFFWIDELFVFVTWVVNSMPFVIDFVFH